MAPNNDNFNADELEAPGWLNAQFFHQVLCKYENATSPDLKVLDIKTSPASLKGDHYASVMFRVCVDYTIKNKKSTKSLIVKTMPEEEGHKKNMLGESHIFKTEVSMYSKMLPKFETILREAGDQTVLYTPCLYHSLEPRQVMVFGDLVTQDYGVMRDRDPTMEEVQCAFMKLAKLHAISFKLLKEGSSCLEEFKYGLAEIPGLLNDGFVTGGMKLFLELLDAVPELTFYKPYFEEMHDNYLSIMKKILVEFRENPQPRNYYVLSHGDFHLRNMMFKSNKESGKFEDCMLLDFQISNICPITIDVIYSIYMLMSSEQRRNSKDELIEFYFNTFLQCLRSIEYKGELPNFVEFQRQMNNHHYFDIFLLVTFLPLMYAVKAGNFEPSEMMENEEARRKCYYVKEFIEELKVLLPRYLEQGYLK